MLRCSIRSSRPGTDDVRAGQQHAALATLGVERPVVVAHSFGTLVAIAMALAHPSRVAGLVLAGGYYYPTMRWDALPVVPVALPVLGDVLRYTVSALSARALLGPSVKGMFAPQAVPPDFFPTLSREMMLRPSQLAADAEDGVFMMPAARGLSARYGELTTPVTLLAGAGDLVVDPDAHAARLHDALPQSELLVLPEVGHMVHYAANDRIVDAVRRMSQGAGSAAQAFGGSAAHIAVRSA